MKNQNKLYELMQTNKYKNKEIINDDLYLQMDSEIE